MNFDERQKKKKKKKKNYKIVFTYHQIEGFKR